MFGIPVAVFGTLATIISVVMVFIGLPKQIITNKRQKSCKGLDKTLFILVLFAYSSWSLYGVAQRDWFLIIANVPGVIFTGIICWQMWNYREWFRWEEGRRKTGYLKMKLFEYGFRKIFVVSTDVLKYPVGSSHPEHKDTLTGYRYYRCTIILRNSLEGGKFWASHSLYNGTRLKIFRTDKPHEVTKVKGRTRYVLALSLGVRE